MTLPDPLVDAVTIVDHPADGLGAVRTEVGHFDAAGNVADTLDEAASWVEVRYGPDGDLLLSREGMGRWEPAGRPVYPGDAPGS